MVHWTFRLGRPDAAGQVPISAARLQALAGRYDLEIQAGEKGGSFRSFAKASAVALDGKIEVKGLPQAGWVRGMLHSPRNGAMALGTPCLYSLQKPLLQSAAAPDVPLLWRPDWVKQYGQPLSSVVAFEAGMQILISAPPPAAPE